MQVDWINTSCIFYHPFSSHKWVGGTIRFLGRVFNRQRCAQPLNHTGTCRLHFKIWGQDGFIYNWSWRILSCKPSMNTNFTLTNGIFLVLWICICMHTNSFNCSSSFRILLGTGICFFSSRNIFSTQIHIDTRTHTHTHSYTYFSTC